ncbi:phosphoglycerate kinase [Paracrocinitomix mangrovi]|uniref:phosphoglycerate kinase n=1 Tax=Paracrocinitomix mangrovi TaxID=2862509 RepID=UPI001C8F19DB|nr:phosphoglycerate kinase [Paracrocinitomix mangrovi]UKN03223.1 phosphoglycerate kinase [Paracrocinitomix mangrovi]
MKNISSYNFAGKRALIRVDFNVPLNKETLEVTDDTRIKAAIPTIKKVLESGGSVVLMSHLGRPKNIPEDKFSLKNIISKVEENLGQSIQFATDCISAKAFEMSANLKPGEVLLLENLRFHEGEKKGDVEMAKKLAQHGDVYINDAFGTAHRAHASTAVIAQFFPNDKMFGYLIEKEIESVDKVLKSNQKPLTAIVGGAKVSSKISIITELMNKVDNLIVGGGMAYTFIKAQGGQIGNSLVEEDFLETAREIMSAAKEKGVNLLIPTDTIIADEFSNEANTKSVKIDQIPDGWMGLDIAEDSIKAFKQCVLDSKLILWNGPMGVFELEKFQNGTKEIALAVAKATKNGAFSLVGGGDSVAAVNQFHLADQVSHVSTGGGAMLEYLEGVTLPGIAAIIND